jgi:hypothetical protein
LKIFEKIAQKSKKSFLCNPVHILISGFRKKIISQGADNVRHRQLVVHQEKDHQIVNTTLMEENQNEGERNILQIQPG